MNVFNVARPLLLTLVGLVLVGCESPNTSQQAPPPRNEKPEVKQDARHTRGSTNDDLANDRLLRHAVFLKFKQESSPSDLTKVVDAFVSLKNRIPAIVDLQWGENNSPEKLNAGFTHCFILTFKDEAGRDAYLPHPEHKAFGGMLRPHVAGVFVIDYWGQAVKHSIDKPLKHAVFFKFKDDATADQIEAVETAFADLPASISAIKGFEWGVNNSPEKHDAGFTHCFMVTFESEEGRREYLPHPAHKAFVEVLKPVLGKTRVMDFWATR